MLGLREESRGMQVRLENRTGAGLHCQHLNIWFKSWLAITFLALWANHLTSVPPFPYH